MAPAGSPECCVHLTGHGTDQDVGVTTDPRAVTEQVEHAMEQWFDRLPRHRGGLPAQGTIGTALVVLERLRSNFSLNLEDHRATGGAQIQGVSGRAVADILARFGENRPFLSEGGRTNRGGPTDIAALLSALANTDMASLSADDRDSILTEVTQSFLVRKVEEFHNRERVTFDYDPRSATAAVIRTVLEQARGEGKEGEVAQHLVGAKLQLRFPGEQVDNESATTADLPTGRSGDFQIGQSAFHVTVAPQVGVATRCERNLRDGLRPYLLVPERRLLLARQLVDELADQVAVQAIESFIAQNLDELGSFSADGQHQQLAALLLLYNFRVDAVETNKSLLIELPPPLQAIAQQVREYLVDARMLPDN